MKKNYQTSTVLTVITNVVIDIAQGNTTRLANLVGCVLGDVNASNPDNFFDSLEPAKELILRNHPELAQIPPVGKMTLDQLQVWYQTTLRQHNLGPTFAVETQADFLYGKPPEQCNLN